MTDGPPSLTIRTVDDRTDDDIITLVDQYTCGWPVTRPIDRALIAHWKSLPQYQPESMLLAYSGSTPRAFLHGEIAGKAMIHLLAIAPGAIAEAKALVRRFESMAVDRKLPRLVGPQHTANVFYGGYILGWEPYHPHWACEVTDIFVACGFRITHPAVIMTAGCGNVHSPESPPQGYSIVRHDPGGEYGAQTMGYVAMPGQERVAHCNARYFPDLKDSHDSPIGQVGGVETNQDHQGKGLARIMVAMCLERLGNAGVKLALIATGLNNFPALRAYERAGFVPKYHIAEWSKDLITP